MTHDEIQKMSGRDLDAGIQRVFVNPPKGMRPVDDPPQCHADLNACHEAEELLEKMGLANDFADKLMLASSDAQAADEYRHSFNWYFAHATASDRAKALLAALSKGTP